MWPVRYQLALLTVLALQNTALILLIKHVTSMRKFPPTLGVILVEITKLVLCYILEAPRHNYSIHSITITALRDPCLTSYAIPALLYTLQNNLCLVAVSRMGPVEYQVLYQSKILTTAFFSWVVLNKTIRLVQWVSLAVLLLGVCVVAVPASSGAVLRTVWRDQLVGMVAIALASLSSGFCGVYMEKITKSRVQKQRSVALQSLGLTIYSLPASIILHSCTHGFNFQGIQHALTNPQIIFLFLMQAGSGFLVGAVIRHSDNVLKGFATSASLVLSAAIASPDNRVLVGTCLVALAAVLYGFDTKERRLSLGEKVKSSNI
jgi:UDP-sugar transporter A1/2/3